ncbi:MAG: glutamine--tRNA ligase/YqeY domain fusion protein [Deltaproteobacteria bacterium]|jgi:glutaminyl-tRNA synthetase|nr:glutamine--tRNA ligase/YqeY domain fusion protein [Deltaproteobacteria bacterium]
MEEERPNNFIRTFIDEDLASGRYVGVATRFPPEPNGYLHIGHAKSICLNFGLARDYSGHTNLRFDDTNPAKEETEYVDSIQEDVRWLGFSWDDRLYYASDYFGKLYECAERLIDTGWAYVCDLSPEEMRAHRGTLTEPGTDSPYRDRGAAESLDLFRRMRAGEFPEGSRSLRARIDMASPNMNMRDPAVYRIKKAEHHRTGAEWCIYPMYDYAHCVSDAIEGITHSICTLEFEDHRPLYDWFLEKLDWPQPRPRQIEFARLNLEYTMMSKRRLLQLVKEGLVEGWDDPRLPTIAAIRRRGFTPSSIRIFCERIGVAKKDSWIELEWLEKAARDDLNQEVKRVMAVLDPVKVELVNVPDDFRMTVEAPFFPDAPSRMGSRELVLTRELYIEREDFMVSPVPGFRRLSPGREARLRWATYVKCVSHETDAEGRVTLVRCELSDAPTTVDEKGRPARPNIIHWVSAPLSVPCVARVYDRLFKVPRPTGEDLASELNPASLVVRDGARLEPSAAGARPWARFQFERLGYFMVDPKSPAGGPPVFNRIVALKDGWKGGQAAQGGQGGRKGGM